MISENPFAEEFDPKDVVNKKTPKKKEIPQSEIVKSPNIDVDTLGNYNEDEVKEKKFALDFNKDNVKDVDLDSLDNYNEEEVREKNFHFEYEADDFTEEEERLQDGFKDFLVARKISGREHGFADANRIPVDKLVQKGEIVEINDDPRIEDEAKHNASTVVVHRNEDGEIVYLDVICSCGRNTLIKLDFDNQIAKDDVELRNVNYSEAADNNMLTMGNHTYNEPAMAVDDTTEYSEDLLKTLDRIEPDLPEETINVKDGLSGREANIIDELNQMDQDSDDEIFDNFDNTEDNVPDHDEIKTEDENLIDEFNEMINDDE